MSKIVKESDFVVLDDKKGNKILLPVNNEMTKIRGLGVFNPNELIGKNYYENITIGNRKYMVLEPSIADKITTIERKAQIILPKDGVFIVFYCDIKSGDRIVEGGVGSGALTILLANSVKPKGMVISYEIRDEFAKIAQRNVNNADLSGYVRIIKGDVTKEITEENVDAVVLDIPNPWDAVKNAKEALKYGGHFACYSPTTNQVEKTVKEMRKADFHGIKTLETLQRELIVSEGGARPSYDAPGHTGYITFGRKIT